MIERLSDCNSLIFYHHTFELTCWSEPLTRAELDCLFNYNTIAELSNLDCALCDSYNTVDYTIIDDIKYTLCDKCHDIVKTTRDRSLICKMEYRNIVLSQHSFESRCIFSIGRALLSTEVGALISAILCWRQLGIIDDILWHIITLAITLYSSARHIDGYGCGPHSIV